MVLGGAKVTDKIGVIEKFLDAADEILIGGAMCFSFFKAEGRDTGESLLEDDAAARPSRPLPRAEKAKARLHLPEDLVLGREFSADHEVMELNGVTSPRAGWDLTSAPTRRPSTLEAGPRPPATVLWNGPMGAFELEPFAAGTRVVVAAVARTSAHSVVGGGDSAAAMVQFGLDDDVDWLSTGGGASLEFLEELSFPGWMRCSTRARCEWLTARQSWPPTGR